MQSRSSLFASVLVMSALATPVLAGSFTASSPFIKDGSGRVVFLHGVNAVWKVKPYYPPSSAYQTGAVDPSQSFFDARDAKLLADNGLNCVRLGVLFAGVAPQPSPAFADPAYLEKIDELVALLGSYGVSVLLDFHQDMYNERFQGEGFPAWATHTEALADQPIPGVGTVPFSTVTAPPDQLSSFGFPLNYFTPPVMRAFDNLWLNNFGLWAGYADAWQAVAARFAGRDNVLGYDLLNEPWPGTLWETCASPTGCPVFDTQRLQPFSEYVINAIRAADTTGIAFWEPDVTGDFGVANDVGLLTPIHDTANNNGISFHDYCLIGGTVPGVSRGSDPECQFAEPLAFQQQQMAAARNGSAMLLTEFGASDDLTDIGRVAALADQNMVGWTYWHYANFTDVTGNPGAESLFTTDDLGRFNADGSANLKSGKADLLIRTYPQAVAGTPKSFAFDPTTGRFTLTFTPDPSITAPTVIFVPARHYPNGYTVAVTGNATQIASGNAQLVEIQNPSSGSGDVTVTITRNP